MCHSLTRSFLFHTVPLLILFPAKLTRVHTNLHSKDWLVWYTRAHNNKTHNIKFVYHCIQNSNMKKILNMPIVASTISCLVLVCLIAEPSLGFQQQKQPSSHVFAGSKSSSSAFLPSVPLSTRRNEKLAWWRNDEQKQYGSFMVDSSAASDEKGKAGLFDKVRKSSFNYHYYSIL